ncbi:MAG: zinc-binding dehydrogenase [Phycisphaerae bacterium]|nr:zinc-binding dehydrogenase [Phycisphaerae bacterium]
MRAALQIGVGQYEVREVPVPEVDKGQCLIQVKACTICGTDVKYFKGLAQLGWPSPMGHEVTGIVAKVGSAVRGFKEGDRVLSRMAWGGFAEYVPSDADLLVHLPENVGFEAGAIAQMLPLAVRGAELSVRRGHRVLVSGLGGAGLMCVQASKAYGAAEVIASDPFDLRRSVALEVGADVVIDPIHEDVVERARSESDGGVDVAMEAAGMEPSFRACEQAIRVGGIVSIYGTHLAPMSVNLREWEAKCLQLHMMAEPRQEKPMWLRKAAGLLAAGKIDLDPLLSRAMPLEEIMDAFRWVIDRPGEVIKVAIVP